MRRFIDTNILVYMFSHDPREEQAAQIVAAGGVISVQSLTELANVLRRKLSQSWEAIGEAIDQVETLCEVGGEVRREILGDALRIAKRYQFSMYDSTLVAVALKSGCDEFLSEDLHDGLVIDGRLTVRNPFAAA
ncbi:MAG: PIN domain-containing protein [Sphingomicrobium sp.]